MFYSQGVPYLLKKGGMWYAHNSCGYTVRAELAEIYNEAEALKYASCCEEVTAVLVTDALHSADSIQSCIDRLMVMKAALIANEKGGT